MANEVTKFTINGVQHDVMDVGARQLIASVQAALNAITSGDTTTAIKTFQEVIDFLDGVTDDATLVGKLNELRTLINGKYAKPANGIPLSDLVQSVQNILSDVANKVDKVNGKGLSTNDYTTEEKTKLAGLPTNPVQSISVNGGTPQTPTNGNVNIEVNGIKGDKGDKGDTGNVQVDGNGNVLIYNGRDMATPGAALDASQGQFLGKLLNANDNAFYNVWVGTQQQLEALNGDYGDNTIYLVGTVPTIAQRYNVSFNGGSHTSIPANTPQAVKEGSAFSVVVSPAIGYKIDSATGTMAGGGTLTKTENQDGTVTFSTSAVTGAITIQAAATKYITGIRVSAGTRDNNTIPLTAVVEPTDADNVTLAWSIDNTTDFVITDNGNGTATLTVKSSASNASVNITCQDTNAASDDATGTLSLTGLSYESTPVPITEITDITATRTAANTLTLEAVTNPADANTPAVTFSLVGTVPTVKQVRRWAAGDTVDGEVKESAGNDVIELPAVELSGNTLTYKGDCQITVRATAGSVTHDEVIDIIHDDADAIWFEDSAVKSVLTSSGIGSGGNVTYAQAEATTTFKRNDVHIFQNNKTIIRFNECKYFKIGTVAAGASSPCRLDGCTALKALSFRSDTYFNANALTSLTALEELTINSGFTTEFISSANTKLKYMKVGNAATSVSNTFQGLKVETVDLGTGIATLPNQCFKSVTTLKSLTLRYNGKVSFGGDQVFANLAAGSVDLYVPADQVSNYANYHAAIKAVHAIED